jgi:hypothetical protein
MMTHPDRLFELAKQRMEQNQQEITLANAQTCVMRHWLAEQVRKFADRLDAANYGGNEVLPLVKR